ncbi:MAG: glycosyltransferase family 4 protein [Anaerolineae bacterium]|nr:glycosyltransferase family 4 protein [Anaerolineae bacterium]
MNITVIGPGFTRAGYLGNHVRAFPEWDIACKLAVPGSNYQAQQPALTAPGLEGYQFKTIKGIPIWPGDWRLLYRLVNWAELVHVYHTAFPICTLAAVVAKMRRKPLVVTTADHIVRKAALWRLNSHLAWLLADTVVAYTKEEKQWLVSIGVNEKKIIKVPLGIDVSRLRSHYDEKKKNGYVEEQALKILFVGRKHPDKNLETLIRCMRAVGNSAGRPVKCMLVGRRHREGYAQKLEQLIDKLNLNNVIDFIGEVPDGVNFLDYYANADIFIDIATFGAFEVVVLEAMAFSLPIIVSRRVGVAEIVQKEKCGYIVDPLDEAQIIQTLLALLKNKEKRLQLGQAGYCAVQERYTYRQMTKSLADLYRAMKKDNAVWG